MIDAGKPLPKKANPKGKPPKAPKPKVDRKIAALKAKPKPKAKPQKQAPKPKAKAKPKQAPKPIKRKKSPVKAGQLKNLSKISVGNIVVKKKKVAAPAGWPKWTEKVLNSFPKAAAEMKDLVEEYKENGEKVDWAEIKQELKDEFFIPG